MDLDNEENVDDDKKEVDVEKIINEYEALKKEHENTKAYLNKANKEAKERRLALKELEENGLSVSEAIELKRRLEEEERERAAKKGDVDKIKEQLMSGFEKEKNEMQKKIDKMQKSLYENLVSAKASEAIVAANGVPKLLMPFIQRYAQVQDEDGKYAVRILDDDSEVRFNSRGEYMTINDYVEELRSDDVFGRAFMVDVKSGSGSKPNGSSGSAGKKQILNRSQMSYKDKAEYVKEHGQEAFLKLPY
jgi:hypothetical protein